MTYIIVNAECKTDFMSTCENHYQEKINRGRQQAWALGTVYSNNNFGISFVLIEEPKESVYMFSSAAQIPQQGHTSNDDQVFLSHGNITMIA